MFARVTFTLTLVLTLFTARAEAQAILVPAYANPCCGSGVAMWSTLIANASSGKVPLHVILEPASGPGASPLDPNYVGVDSKGPAVDLVAAGGRLYGYVPTTYAARPLSAVQADIDTYYDPAYWRGAGVLVSGIFVDEMSNDIARTGYYQAITAYVRAKSARAYVFGNPGTTSVQDSTSGASGFTVDQYARSVDTLVTHENTGSIYRSAYTAPSFVNSLDANHFAHIIHSETASSDMHTDLALARARNAGFVYVTDDIGGVGQNGYDVLPSYWSDELASVRAPQVPALQRSATLALAALLALLAASFTTPLHNSFGSRSRARVCRGQR